jgi:hypothetical protein
MSLWQRKPAIIDAIRNCLWPNRIFQDASKGTLFDRAAAYRHNREVRGYLPQYISNWAAIAVLLACAGIWLENTQNLVASLLCWLLLICTISELALLSALYLLLTASEP